MNIGDLNRRITYTKEGTSIPDGIGGYTVTPGDSVTTWCSANPMSSAETLRYGLADGSRSYKFVMYYEQGNNILQGSDLTYETRTFRVNQVLELKEAKDMVLIIATEQV